MCVCVYEYVDAGVYIYMCLQGVVFRLMCVAQVCMCVRMFACAYVYAILLAWNARHSLCGYTIYLCGLLAYHLCTFSVCVCVCVCMCVFIHEYAKYIHACIRSLAMHARFVYRIFKSLHEAFIASQKLSKEGCV